MLKYMETQYNFGKMLADKGSTAPAERRSTARLLAAEHRLGQRRSAGLDGKDLRRHHGHGRFRLSEGRSVRRRLLSPDHARYILAKKAQHVPMIHGASGPAEHFVDLVENIMEEYSVDVSMFIGHVGCKHTFAASKMVTDMIQDKFGIPTPHRGSGLHRPAV